MLISRAMHTVPRAMKPLVYPAALIYGAIGRVRNAFYDSGLLPIRRLGNPTISIGNITTGGTGKTPLVEYTALKVMELGYAPVILSRGYGRNSPGKSLIVDSETRLQNPAHQMGDEPALIRRHVPQVRFGIGNNRFRVGSLLDEPDSRTVFILDDGLQHRKLHRDFDIAVVDTTQPFASNRMFPLGSLRESLEGLARCNAIIINGSENPHSDTETIVSQIKSANLNADLYYCSQSIRCILPFENWAENSESLPDMPPIQSVFLVAALGNPLRFRQDAEKIGIRVAGTQFYRDHHPIGARDWKDCTREARNVGADAMLITEKDAIKVSSPPEFPLFVSVQKTRVDNQEAYIELLRRSLLNVKTLEC